MELTQYEKNQSFNVLTRWLHGYRFRVLAPMVMSMARALGRPVRILDVGCNVGTLFDFLDPLAPIHYTGIEVRASFAGVARDRHAGISNFTVLHEPAQTAIAKCGTPDLVCAIDTFEHIPEADVVRIVESIARFGVTLFVTVPVEIGPAIWLKNVGSALCGYVRHKEYTWAETLWAGLYQLDKLPPHGIQHKGFDWRWLAQTIRHNMDMEIRRFPFAFLPSAVSSSVCFIAKPRREGH